MYLGTADVLEASYTGTLTPTFTQSSTLPDFPATSLIRDEEVEIDITNLMTNFLRGHAIAVSEPKIEYTGERSPAYMQIYGKGSAYEPVLTAIYK